MIMMNKKKKKNANKVAIKVSPHGINFGYFSIKVFRNEEDVDSQVVMIEKEERFSMKMRVCMCHACISTG